MGQIFSSVSAEKETVSTQENPVRFQSCEGPAKENPVRFQSHEGPAKENPVRFQSRVEPAKEKNVKFQSHIEPVKGKVNDLVQIETVKRVISPTDLRGNEIVWLKHYNNKQRILMVGEGDFSFSASLAVAFGHSVYNITATSLDDPNYLWQNYKNVTENIQKLTNRGATIRHRVDATEMAEYSYWKGIKFDRIIYNFPYANVTKTTHPRFQLCKHRELVSGFLNNAKKMLKDDGEIHISHKTNGFHSDWNIEGLALQNGLGLVREVDFNQSDYPDYETKQGYIGDKNFDCNPSKTYMFSSIPLV